MEKQVENFDGRSPLAVIEKGSGEVYPVQVTVLTEQGARLRSYPNPNLAVGEVVTLRRLNRRLSGKVISCKRPNNYFLVTLEFQPELTVADRSGSNS